MGTHSAAVFPFDAALGSMVLSSTRNGSGYMWTLPRAATESVYRGTIAHGFLVLSFLTRLQAICMAFPGAAQVLNYGFDKVRFTTPVRSGSCVSARFALTHAAEVRPG